jgi:ketosteroid isomerase-like protein
VLKTAEAGDYPTLRDFYAPDAKLWMNTTQQWKTLDQHLSSAAGQRSKWKKMRYAESRVTPFDDGYVQQFRAQAVAHNGKRLDLPVCMVIRLQGQKIVQREEYLDGAALQDVLKD